MPITYQGDLAVFDGICTIEEADGLIAWLQQTADAGLDLARCKHFHAALLQVLLQHRPRVVHDAEEPFLQQWILPLLKGKRSAEEYHA